MSDLMSLPGFDPPPKPTDRLLFAVLPDISVAMCIEQLAHALRSKHALHGTPLHAGQLHITLLGLGDHVGLPKYLLAAAFWAASQITQEAFPVRFDKVLTFRYKSRVSDKYPTVLCSSEGATGLTILHKGLVDALRSIGFGGMSASLTPHMTLLYDRQKILEHTVEPVEWGVREFVLLRRHIDQRRPYSVLGKWPLRGVPHAGLF
ncbi:2'-5' RNA ligase family protein [Paraherbaspirillum soli]|uniref:2'-5' RNA ligase family protein n=1 Tax=Paraherbaspirillum soli TaxID=631222 RepID=A0ABW0M8F9_9BURK